MAESITVQPLSLMPKALAAAWLACPPAAQGAWLAAHGWVLNLALLEELKRRSDQALRDDAHIAEEITAGMLCMAAAMPNEPLAFPLAWWARGNHFSFTNPQQAVDCYERALSAYRQAGERDAVLTLISNLLYVQCELDLTAADELYTTALREWHNAADAANLPILRRIEQNGGILLRRLGRYEEALKAHQRALALTEQLAQTARIPEILGNIALTLGDLGRFQECERYLLQSRSAALAVQNQLTAARMEMNLGELYTILGRPADALQAFTQAHAQFALLNNPMELASVALREAHLLERLGALAQASRRYRLANMHFSALQMWPQVWQATVEGARAKRRYGEYAQAAAFLAEAADLLQQQSRPVWQSEWRLEAAALALARHQWMEAEQYLMVWQTETPQQIRTPRLQARSDLLWGELWADLCTQMQPNHRQQRRDAQQAYQRVLVFAEQQGELQLKRQALAGLGRLSRADAPRQAEAFLREAAAQDELIRADLSVQEIKADFLNQSSDVLEQLFVWATADGNATDALLHSWRAKGSALVELVRGHQPTASAIEQPQRNEAAAVITERIQELRHRLAVLQWQAGQEAQRQKRPQSAVEAEVPEIAHLEQQLTDLRRQRNRQQPNPIHFSSQTLHEIATTMTADRLIEFMQAQGQLYATVLDQSGAVATVQLGEVNDLLDLLDELTLHFRSLLTLPPTHRSHPRLIAECRALLAQGYDWLIRPLSMPTTVTQLLIAPCAPLHRIPFAALWDGTGYLVERYQIELTPTAALCTAPPPNVPVTHPLVITDAAAGLLPANRCQADAIRVHFPDVTALCDDPHALHYLQNLTIAPRFLHIAAHTVEREDAPLFTALQLTNTMLTIEQSYELPLHGTELVTLSSCVTNSGMDSAGAILALQSAFFAAGAQRVLSTLWEIQSEVTEEWMATFYRHLQTGLLPPVALRRTQLEFIQHREFGHPVYWAAFACSRR